MPGKDGEERIMDTKINVEQYTGDTGNTQCKTDRLFCLEYGIKRRIKSHIIFVILQNDHCEK